MSQPSLALTGPQWPRPCHTRNTVMVGPSVLPLLLLLLSAGSEAQDSCSLFRKEYCSLRLDKIMMLDTALTSPSMCQVSVKRKKLSTLPRDLSRVHYRRLAFITVAELLIFHFSISSKTVVLYGSFTQDQSVSKSIIYRVLSLLKGASLIQKLRCWRFIGCPCPCHPRLHTGSSHLCHLATPSQLTKVSHNFFVFD